MSAAPELRVTPEDHNAPVTKAEFREWTRTVADHEQDLNDRDRGRIIKALEDIDSLKHTRTATSAILGFITYLLGVITAFAAVWALKP